MSNMAKLLVTWSKKMKNKSFLFDRDGVLIVDRKYLTNKANIFLFPGVFEALCYLKKKKIKVFIITNQSVIGRGLISNKNFGKLSKEINFKISKYRNINLIEKVYYCPHHPKKGIKIYKKKCTCRKPNNGLIEKAISENKLDRKKTIMMGDKITDYLAAKKSKINFYYKKNHNFLSQVRKIINNENF